MERTGLERLIEKYQEGLITEGDLLKGVLFEIDSKLSVTESNEIYAGMRLLLDRECVQGDKITARTHPNLEPLACKNIF